MPTRYIKRSTDLDGGQVSRANANAIYVDSDDDQLKFTTGTSGTTTVDVVTESQTQTLTNKTLTSAVVATDFGVPDDVSIELGTDDDSVLRHRSATLAANTALTDVLIGTPVTQALAANSLVVSNTTASGDILIAANRGGNSEEYLFADASAGTLTLTAPGGAIGFESGTTNQMTIDSTGVRAVKSAEVVSAANVITAAESGRVFFLNSASEFASTLPAPALGLEYLFIVTAAPSGASYTVVTEGGCQILAGHVLTSGFADSGSDVETTATGTTVNFVDGISVVGDRAHLISDGTSWFASCICAVEAGITITG